MKEEQKQIESMGERLVKKFAPNEIVPDWDEYDAVGYPELELFIAQEIQLAVEEDRKIFIEKFKAGEICHNCGKDMKFGLSELCSDCLEEA